MKFRLLICFQTGLDIMCLSKDWQVNRDYREETVLKNHRQVCAYRREIDKNSKIPTRIFLVVHA